MKQITWFSSALMIRVLVVLMLVCPSAYAALPGEVSADRTLSPYFFVKSDGHSVDRMPLKATSAHVNIAGVIADVRVAQVYKNEGDRPLEAVYIFPASTRAAVHAMRMTIGKRVIEAKIEKREEARRQYEQAREQGKSASLLEQQRPNVFQMNVANIMPGDEIKVELRYTELLVPTDRIYEFVYPTVVGPRYSNVSGKEANPSDKWVHNPYLRQGETVPYSFDVETVISGGMTIREITCPSHKVKISYNGPATAKVVLDTRNGNGGNKDYVLRYRLDGNEIQSGLLLYEGEKENFFLLTMQPPKKVAAAQIPGREYIFVVDVSGSMYGYPLEISKKLMTDLLGRLRPSDMFNVVLFSGGSAVMADRSVPATGENISKAVSLIDRQHGGGGTELLPALERVFSLPKAKAYSRSIVIATDGYVSVEERAFDLIRQNLGNSNVFAFGIGTAVNRHLIEGMARVGMGEPFVITAQEEAGAKAAEFRTLIESPVLTGVSVKFDGLNVYDVEPPSIPDVLSERPIVVFGKYRGRPQGRIVLQGNNGEGAYNATVDVSEVHPTAENSALRYLWARHRIALLSDYNLLRMDDERAKEVTRLGLTYNLLTSYTSFVAVDTEVRNTTGSPVSVKQPLPLPEGVSNHAVGGNGLLRPMVMSAPAPAAATREMKAEYKAPARLDKSGPAEEESKARKQKTTGGIDTSPNLNDGEVRRLADIYVAALDRACLKGLSQKVVVKITVTANGAVKAAEIPKETKIVSATASCLVAAIKKWQFPGTSDGKEGTILLTITVVS